MPKRPRTIPPIFACPILSRRKLLIAWFLAFQSLANFAFAERPPLPEEQLVSDSDLIVEADVLSVTKTGTTEAPVWLARLHIRKTLKGNAPSNPMEYWFLPPEPSLAGGRNETVFAGQYLRLYLIRNSNGQYVPWASNSIELLKHFAEDRYVLPRQLGEVLRSDGRRILPDLPRTIPAFSIVQQCESGSVQGQSLRCHEIIRVRCGS